MITKAIVEDVIDRYNIKIRIPSLDRTPRSSVRTLSDNLDVAIICTLPHFDLNIQRGDIVIVAWEETEEEPIILGYLYRSKMTDTYVDCILSSVHVNNNAHLPHDTFIGDVMNHEIHQLTGIRANIQKQIDELQAKLIQLEEKIESVTGGE